MFVPGNAGSYKQARSMASEASKIFLKNQNNSKFLPDLNFGESKHNFHFNSHHQQRVVLSELDFFSLDFREELSILDGNILLDQSYYVNDCINFILNVLYSNVSLFCFLVDKEIIELIECFFCYCCWTFNGIIF